MPPALAQWIPPAVVIAVLLYIHRSLRQDMSELRGDVRELRQHSDTQIGNLRDRLGRIERRLDELREFFFRSGGTAA